MPRFRIHWQGHPDITNKVEKDVKLKETNKQIHQYCYITMDKLHYIGTGFSNIQGS